MNGTEIPFFSDGMSFPARGFMQGFSGQGYRKVVKMNTTSAHMFADMFEKHIVVPGWIDDPATLGIIITFFIYNPNTFLVQEKKLAIEFLTPGLFINLEHSMQMINVKLYRNDTQQAVSSIAIILGFVLIGLSTYQIYLEEEDKKLAEADEDGEEEEGAAPAEAKADDKKKKEEG